MLNKIFIKNAPFPIVFIDLYSSNRLVIVADVSSSWEKNFFSEIYILDK